MLKIAGLLEVLGHTCDMNDIRGSYSRVLSDANFLATRSAVAPQKWQEGYREVFGHYPLQHLFEQNADDAIRSAEELQGFAKAIGHLNPGAPDAAGELLRRLKKYRDSVASYF